MSSSSVCVDKPQTFCLRPPSQTPSYLEMCSPKTPLKSGKHVKENSVASSLSHSESVIGLCTKWCEGVCFCSPVQIQHSVNIMKQRFPFPAGRGLFTAARSLPSDVCTSFQRHVYICMNLNLARKISAPVSLIEKKKGKRRQLLGGKCEVIYHGCGWRRGRRRGGGKEPSPGTPPVAALILSRSRLGRDNKTFTAINPVSHSGLFLRPGLSGALQTQ